MTFNPGTQALITGASSGIGQAVALMLAANGADVWLLARNTERLANIQQQCQAHGVNAHVMCVDLSDEQAVNTVIPTIEKQTGRLDILINNAGMPCHYAWSQIHDGFWQQVMQVNLLAPIALTFAALPLLKKSQGHVIHISSLCGILAVPREMIYSASKFGLAGFSEGLSLELANEKIANTVIYVGPIDTQIWEKVQKQGGSRYRGKRYPPSIVAKTIMRCLKTRQASAYTPFNIRFVVLFKRCFPRLFNYCLLKWDQKK